MVADSQGNPAGLAAGLAHGKGTSAVTTKITFVADRFKDHGVGCLFVSGANCRGGSGCGCTVRIVPGPFMFSQGGSGPFESVRCILISM